MTHILIFIHWFVLVFTFGNVELVTIDNSKSNDFPIEELNGYTLREVFEVGNLVNINNWIDRPNYGGSYSIVDNEIIVIVTNSYGGIEQPLSLNVDDIFYHYFKVKGNPNLYLGTDDRSFNLTKINEIEVISYNAQSYQTVNSVFIRSEIAQTFYVYDVRLINMTFHGISSLTDIQMNYWFNVYQENEQREISDTYDYVENELTTNDLIYIVLFALLWGLAIKIVKGVM